MDEQPRGERATQTEPVRVAYISSESVIEREAMALVRDIEAQPGYWRPFVVRHALLAVALLGLVVGMGIALRAPAEGLRALLTVVVTILVALVGTDWYLARRRVRRAVRLGVWHGCPPGTVVRAAWDEQRVVFTLPTHEIAVDLATVTAARPADGVLFLDQQDRPRAWVVPDELLGAEALEVLRRALGPRFGQT